MSRRIVVATCVPEQRWDFQMKMEWLAKAVTETDCNLFLTPQEYFGGLWASANALHVDRQELDDRVGSLAHRTGKAIGVGAAVGYSHDAEVGVEEFIYYDTEGEPVGVHRKFALPSYDDVAKGGAGQLVPERVLQDRVEPVRIEELDLVIGTVFCWEIFSLTLLPSYAQRGVNLIVHPIKFAPQAWPVLTPKGSGPRKIVTFKQDFVNHLWQDKIVYASRHEVLCPIAVTCNTWNLGPTFRTLVGVYDGIARAGGLRDTACNPEDQLICRNEIDPSLYDALHKRDKELLLAQPGLRHWTMHNKMREIERKLVRS